MDPEDKFLHSLRKSEQSKQQEPSHKTWERIQHVLESKKKKRKILPVMYWQQIAATFLLICFLSVVYYFFIKSPSKKDLAINNEVQNETPKIVTDTTQDIALMEESSESNIADSKPANAKPQEVQSAKRPKFAIKEDQKLAYESKPNMTEQQAPALERAAGSNAADQEFAKAKQSRSGAAPASALQSIPDLFPADAKGRYAGTCNEIKYTATLKGGGTKWELIGFYVSRTKMIENFRFAEGILNYELNKKLYTYRFEAMDNTQHKYVNPKDPDDYFMISYSKNKIMINQYGKANTSGPVNTWVLTKAFE